MDVFIKAPEATPEQIAGALLLILLEPFSSLSRTHFTYGLIHPTTLSSLKVDEENPTLNGLMVRPEGPANHHLILH